ncbi:g2372 [Coccomyxa viridis]|uniref:G2372 protein n=1 Tax=Coccomyxa viridis TaxID=1274662 RepID=A0ABP1FK96_9CHLO
MDTSCCYQRSITGHVQSDVCSYKAFSSPRFHEGRLKFGASLMRKQHERLQQCTPQHTVHRLVQRLQSRPCRTSATPAQAVKTAAQERSTDSGDVSDPPRLSGVGVAALLALCTGGGALASEAGDALVSQGPDLLTTVLFSATSLALLILSVGVVYLSVVSFFDKRAETEARKKFDEVQKSRELQAANPGKPKVKRRRTQDELSRGGGKGFGG